MKLLEFACVGHRFAVPVSAVARVVPSAQPEPLPGAPAMVSGALAVAGEAVVLIDLAQRFGLGQVALSPQQRIVILRVPGFVLGLAVDEPLFVTEQDVETGAVPSECASEAVSGMVLAPDGLRILIDPEHILLREDQERLRRALAEDCHG